MLVLITAATMDGTTIPILTFSIGLLNRLDEDVGDLVDASLMLHRFEAFMMREGADADLRVHVRGLLFEPGIEIDLLGMLLSTQKRLSIDGIIYTREGLSGAPGLAEQ